MNFQDAPTPAFDIGPSKALLASSRELKIKIEKTGEDGAPEQLRNGDRISL